ncbi:MAG: SRPBCC family protein, partial [Limisphaerales bacterium]
KMEHKDVAAYLYETHKVGGWWSQMITVGYEQARGKREKHQRAEGHYDISVSRTLEVPVSKVFNVWQNDQARKKWLGEDGLLIRKATPNKSMRITWVDQKTSLELNFYPKGLTKSQVVVQHSKLSNAKAAAKMKSYWSNNLERLKEFLKA